MPDPSTLRALFSDTVERHVSPARYRLEKVAHVALLGLAGTLAGLSGPAAYLLAGWAYWLVGVTLALPELRWLDKARDLALCLLTGFAVAGRWWAVGVCCAVNLLLVRVKD